MAKLQDSRPKSLSDYLGKIEKLQAKAGHALWFRGTGVSTYKLVPTLYRHPKAKRGKEMQDLERQLMMRFRQRGLPYHSRDLKDDWEALFFMQHYGVPTRLLDWSENPLTALHFALMSAPQKTDTDKQVQYKKSAAVWILDPVAWNKQALKHISYQGEPLVPGDEPLKGYAPNEGLSTNYPVALYGAHNSARIVAQQGVFTIFGTQHTAMEASVRKGVFPAAALSRALISPGKIGPMRDSLLRHGITESTVFPDLEGLARETKRHFGFES